MNFESTIKKEVNMSFKVYSGRKLNGSHDLLSFYNTVNELKANLRNAQYEFVLGQVLNNCIKNKGQSDNFKTEVSKYMSKLNDDFLGNYLNLDVHIIFYINEERVLLIPFCSNHSFGKVLESELDNFSSFYGYWDNTDSDGSSEEEWSQRERDWKKVLSPGFIPDRKGIDCQITFDKFSIERLTFSLRDPIEEFIKKNKLDITLEELF